jgi:PiT family inorganic phosphate transporter
VWVVLCGLLGAITWNLLTWWWGLPSSSSHALIGGVGGAGVAYAGWNVLVWKKIKLVLIFILGAPLIGLVLGSLIMLLLSWLFRRTRPQKVDNGFRVGQLFSAGGVLDRPRRQRRPEDHGHHRRGDDRRRDVRRPGQGLLARHPRTGSCSRRTAAMAFGTAIGGWRIVKTMGMGLTHLKPVGGFAAEVAGAVTLFTASHYHVPVSTTHTITGAIIGVGSTNKLRGIRWSLAGRIVWAWIFTIPASFAVGFIALKIAEACGAW